MGTRGRVTDDLKIELSPVDRLIARTTVVGVGEYVCPIDHPQFKGGGPESCPYIVFSRSAVKLLPSRGRGEICSPVTVNLLDIGDSYERKAVSASGVRCDWIAVSPTAIRDIVRGFDPRAADSSSSLFNRAVAPISLRTFMLQRQFFMGVQASRMSTLMLEETALMLVSRVLSEALCATKSLPAMSTRANGRRQIEIVEEAKHILAKEYAAEQSIADIAQRVHCSPAYLCRIFTRIVGCTLHEYKQQIRLRSSLDLICDRRFNGARIASELGFSSHSHLTDTFHRRFGTTPGKFAKSAGRSGPLELRDELSMP